MTLGELLQQFAGQGESDPQAAAYLRNPQSRPEITNRGRYRAPVPPAEVRRLPDRARVVPQFRPFTQPELEQGLMAFPYQQMQTTNTRILPPEHMGNYRNFADWVQAPLAQPPAPDVLVADNQIWRNPETGSGPNVTRFPGPRDAPATAIGQDRPRIAIRGGSPLMQSVGRAQFAPPPGPMVTPQERAQAQAEEEDLIYRQQLREAAQRRRGLFGGNSSR